MIALRDLVVTVDNFTLRAALDAPAGAICAVIGPSGGGKSTLLMAVAGFAPTASGRILIDGRDVAALAPADRPVSLLFQDNNLFPHLDIARNVGLGLRPSLRLTATERDRVEAALAEVGLAGLGAHRPEQLSGGQRQRAALARALLRDQPALLLDEPFAALGPGQRAQMLALTRAVAARRGAAVLMVTHDPSEAQAADLCAFCDGGGIEGARPAAAVFADPPPAMAAYLGERR